eukprot:928234-Pelagomonas_calceolata.AAC.1
MPTWQCDIIIRSVDLMKEGLRLQPDTSDEVAMPAPEVITSECACIYNTNGKCVGMLIVDGLKTLLEAFEAARGAGIHATIQPPVQDPATEITRLLSCQKAQQKISQPRAKSSTILYATMASPSAIPHMMMN